MDIMGPTSGFVSWEVIASIITFVTGFFMWLVSRTTKRLDAHDKALSETMNRQEINERYEKMESRSEKRNDTLIRGLENLTSRVNDAIERR